LHFEENRFSRALDARGYVSSCGAVTDQRAVSMGLRIAEKSARSLQLRKRKNRGSTLDVQ
jgi:hypothetical protein